ncbi:DUF1543 domain-containing protein [Xenorhabdus khoisanae]|uniref:DUF1543 domain-containing protein n=1 Tax=Xenorhabdus TaxID=626 RepID=UPI0023596E23|nr:DUF1543 domain-containing protein [Xenorhabdus khoisanae]MDC9613072.1 DUF1543 domain-containing protein [Xenorhabdus khoisanae]
MPQLYMFYLGGNAGKSNIEVHDVQFVAVAKIEETKEKAKESLLSGYDQLHKDNLKDVDDCLLLKQVSGYYIHLTENPHGQPDKPEWQGYRPIGIKD